MHSRLIAALLGAALAAIPLVTALIWFPSGGGTLVIVLVPFAIPGVLLLGWALRGGEDGTPR